MAPLASRNARNLPSKFPRNDFDDRSRLGAIALLIAPLNAVLYGLTGLLFGLVAEGLKKPEAGAGTEMTCEFDAPRGCDARRETMIGFSQGQSEDKPIKTPPR